MAAKKAKSKPEAVIEPVVVRLIAPMDCNVGDCKSVKKGDPIFCPGDIRPGDLSAFINAGWEVSKP